MGFVGRNKRATYRLSDFRWLQPNKITRQNLAAMKSRQIERNRRRSHQSRFIKNQFKNKKWTFQEKSK